VSTEPDTAGQVAVLDQPPLHKPKHTVADIHYGRHLSYSACTCGETFTSDDPEDMSRAYARHIEEVGQRRRSPGYLVQSAAQPGPESPDICYVAGCEMTWESCVQHNARAVVPTYSPVREGDAEDGRKTRWEVTRA
jgi:hypothetical protein